MNLLMIKVLFAIRLETLKSKYVVKTCYESGHSNTPFVVVMMLGSEVVVEGKARVVVWTVALLVVVCTLASDPDNFADASLSSSFILMTTTASATETAIMAAKASTSIQLTHCDLDSLRLSLILKKYHYVIAYKMFFLKRFGYFSH